MSLVQYRLDDQIATITLDDGKRNALSVDLLGELHAALDRAASDRALVVLTGREGVFSAGFDLTVMKTGGDAAFKMLHEGFSLTEKLMSYERPVIVACPGHAIAMGVFTLLAADYRIGAEGPFKYSANEVAIGLTMPRVAIEVCRHRLTPAAMRRALLLSEVFDPHAAVQAGFLDRIATVVDLLHAAHQVAREFLKLDAKAFRESKARLCDPILASLHHASALDDEDYRKLTTR